MKRYLTGKHFTAFRMIINMSRKRDSRLISAAESYLVISVCTVCLHLRFPQLLSTHLSSCSSLLLTYLLLHPSAYWLDVYISDVFSSLPNVTPCGVYYLSATLIIGCKTTTLHRQFWDFVMIKIINCKIKCCQRY